MQRPSTHDASLDLARRLADALQSGDAHGAAALLVELYGESVYRYCRRMLGTDSDSDDVSQVVFLQAFEAIQRGSKVDNAPGWLLGIARHRCLDRLQKRRRDPVLVEADELERVLDADATDMPAPRDAGSQHALEDCLDALDGRSRAVVLLRFSDDLSYEDIGNLTGDSPGALRVRVARALRALRSCLERKGGAP